MAKGKRSTPPSSDEFVRLFFSLNKESDRGFALIVTAWIDDALREVLRTRFIDDAASVDELLGTDSPLGTLSAKIKAAYCLGLVDARLKRELDLIRRIRNDFAHERGELSFTAPHVKSRCESFALLAEVPGTRPGPKGVSPRNTFMLVAAHVLLHLIDMAKMELRPSNDPAKELEAFFAKRRAMQPRVEKLVAWAKQQAAKKKGKPGAEA